ncbi:MAG: bifunctional phosphopantothenoylcysteine decarboxylase/phosphopantothenate--cysteine ligase CoaBC [Calditrichia bacterium]
MFPTYQLRDKKILVGITGGVAAYKTMELIRYLTTNGAEVRVMMTKGAEQFITRLTVETLSKNPVETEMFPKEGYSGTHHIHRADWADAAIIAPATYNFIGKIWGGVADDLLTTTVAALHCPVVIAPAMNVNMWNNAVLQRNVQDLAKMGCLICPPEEGFLAEGYTGMGRLASLDRQIQYLYRAIHSAPDSLKHKKVLVTAGRTEEPLDPVRFLTNHSSGKMGYALAWEAFARGAEVTLIHGPGELSLPAGMKTVATRTAEEMFHAVREHLPQTDIYLSAAAVADYKPEKASVQKIKKQEGKAELALERTPDILDFAGKNKAGGQLLVGFAVETEQGEQNALKKLKNKNLDMVVLNNPLEKGSAFRSDTNHVILFHKNGEKKGLSLLPKLDVASEIFNFLLEHRDSA